MKRFGWALGCAFVLALTASVPAAAQSVDSDLGTNWNLRAGFFVPERSNARAAEGDIWLTVGAERAFYQTDRWAATTSIDYYGSGRLYNVPITINLVGNTKGMRFGTGAGIGISHDFEQGILGFTANVLLGYQLATGGSKISFDVRYHYLSTGHGQLNGWGFTFGFQF
ncbi:MAG: hypothetical protein ACP5VE_04830 [Chthonomonadales bacterium]